MGILSSILTAVFSKSAYSGMKKIEDEYDNKIIWTEKDDARVDQMIADSDAIAKENSDRKWAELVRTKQTCADKISRGETIKSEYD